MKLRLLPLCSAILAATSALPSLSVSTTSLNTTLAGYLGVFFLGDAPNIYFYLSDGANAIAFKALNKGNPILKPTLGTKGVRDPSIISGNGTEEGKKWFIIGTDLDIAKTTWDASQRKGSQSIHIWESTDLINWDTYRLVKVEDNAGMVWAPDAIWDPAKGQYLVHWASRFYSSSDTSHTGSAGPDQIRYAYTPDFVTFSKPSTLISYAPTSIIDLCILQLSPSTFIRFLKNETASNVFMEVSTTGLFGTWTRPGGKDAFVRQGTEGPYAYKDFSNEGKVVVILDFYGGDGYKPFTGEVKGTGGDGVGLTNGGWTDATTKQWPGKLRHGSVLAVTQAQYEALGVKWGG